MATKEQSAALAALRNRSDQHLATKISAPAPTAEIKSPETSQSRQGAKDATSDARTEKLVQQSSGGRSSGAMLVSFDDAGDDGADTTQISLRLPRPHLRALRQWAAEQTIARSDARTVTAQQIILKLIEGAIRHRDANHG